jgi:site-specific DNA recombinase
MKTPNELKDINERTALVYARVSTKEQDPRAQVHRCQEYCRNNNIGIEKVFEDKFTGGGDFMERPAMKELLDYSDKRPNKKFIIIFDDLKRMARDVEFHLKLRRVLRSCDIIPFCLNYEFGESPEDYLMEVFSALQGDVERQQNKRQVIQKQRARLERGYWAFGSPQGYTQEKDNIHGRLLTPKEPAFSLIKEALEGYASGRFHTQQDACNFLTESEYKGRGKKVYLTHFKEKLAQKIVYAGYIEYPKWDVSRRKGYHKGAISLETFEKIQQKLKSNANTHYRKNNAEDFPLRSFIECMSCDTKLTASWSTSRGKAYGNYKCRKKGCEFYGKSMPYIKVHEEFEKVLKSLNTNSETIEIIKEVFMKKWEERMKRMDLKHDKSQEELLTIETDINSYLEMAKNSTSQAIKIRYEKNADDLIKHQQLIEENLKKKPRDKYEVGNALDLVLGFLKSPYYTWQNGDLEERQMLLKLVFDKNLKYDRNIGVGNAQISEIVSVFNVIEKPSEDGSHFVEMGGLEPPCKKEAFKRLHI